MDHERNLSLSEVIPFWWYAAWRLFVTMFAISIVLSMAQFLLPLSPLINTVLELGIIILGVFLQVWFLKKSLNRTYKPYQRPAFRISVEQPATLSEPASPTHSQ